jgi:hypothetical protein
MDPAFDVGTGPNSTVQSLVRSPDGSIYVLGTFNFFNGQARPSGLARIGPTGQLDDSFNPPLPPVTGANSRSALDAGEMRPLAGGLEARKGVVRPNGGITVTNPSGSGQTIVSVDPSGAVSSEVIVPVQGAANTLAVTDEEDVAVGGGFTTLGGIPRSNIGVFNDASQAARILALSCRGRVSGGDRILILGFVITGPEAMRVLVRGVGPTLSGAGVAHALLHPQLTIFRGPTAIAENHGWRAVPDPDGFALLMRQVGTFDLQSVDDTALVMNLTPGVYTAQISGQNGEQGVALGEIYAVDQGNSRLVALAARGTVGTGEDALIPGFAITGGPRLVLLRVVGPGLAQIGFTGTLAHPLMALHGVGGTLASNQGWMLGFDPAAVRARSTAVGAFALNAQSADAALLQPLDPGPFSVVVNGADGGTGLALVEVYDASGVAQSSPNP